MAVRLRIGFSAVSGICPIREIARRVYHADEYTKHFRRQHSTKPDIPNYDVVIVGGGIVGAATARDLSHRNSTLKLAIVEKEQSVARHQSGHNSGVIHAGIYYTPGSLKAKLCVQGLKETYKYCDANNIPYKKVGKLIVAVTKEEASRLDGLFERGLQNEVPDLELIGPDKIMEIEPNCRGKKAIYSPVTGIVDWAEVTKSYARNFEDRNGKIYCNFEVSGLVESPDNPDYPITIINSVSNSDFPRIRAKYIITCGGLYSDKIAQLSGCNPEPKIVPFRGEYLQLIPERCNLINGNIYPVGSNVYSYFLTPITALNQTERLYTMYKLLHQVPNPRFPFLGVHFTPRMDGSVWLGPNAVLAFKREGYSFTDINLKELAESVSYRGTRKLVLRNITPGIGELYRRAFRRAQVRILQQFVPGLKIFDVMSGPTGVRAQALDRDGKLVDDFIFDYGSSHLGKRMLHVRNAPSPAATSSIPIGRMVADKARQNFKL